MKPKSYFCCIPIGCRAFHSFKTCSRHTSHIHHREARRVSKADLIGFTVQPNDRSRRFRPAAHIPERPSDSRSGSPTAVFPLCNTLVNTIHKRPWRVCVDGCLLHSPQSSEIGSAIQAGPWQASISPLSSPLGTITSGMLAPGFSAAGFATTAAAAALVDLGASA